MRWMSSKKMMRNVSIAHGYRLELLKRSEIDAVVCFVKSWFPDISVGTASCYLRREFYSRDVFLEGEREKDVLVVLIRHGEDLVGLFSCDRDRDALTLYARLAVVKPDHRGAHLAQTCIALAEAIAREMGMGMIYGMATLKIPHVQSAFERLGWQIIGITPGFDREMVAPGVVKRVFEVVYAKVLVARSALQQPKAQNMTEKTRSILRLLFPKYAATPGPRIAASLCRTVQASASRAAFAIPRTRASRSDAPSGARHCRS